MLRQTGCDAVMIGRPALRNPWIFAQLSALLAGVPVPRFDGPALLDHFARYVAGVRVREEAALVGLVKEQLRYTMKAVPDGAALLKRLLRSNTLSELFAALEQQLAGLAAAELDLGPSPRATTLAGQDNEALSRYAGASFAP